MKMNSTQLNGYDILDVIQRNNENNHLETEQNGTLDKNHSKDEDIKVMPQQNDSAHRTEVLTGTEQAILHGLFGSEKPSELSFYGQSDLGHIHRGQLMDISG
ncbi:uncharacterized protein METZ01_LOCUS132335 [marine metagenome]|jgi:hypothetical protein|uniref:Uncharacterized protein n=1 Tax=marine metagenome TaxID=408172 RepID=A0A381YS82_9ZZZZ|tara:strand:+ start:392 stop:697 length:306 start_codon:yes stop_codon:yes gene_type:complete